MAANILRNARKSRILLHLAILTLYLGLTLINCYVDLDFIRNFALSLKNTEESLPFGPDTLVFKSGGKIFLLLSLDEVPVRINVKCEPEKAEELRARHKSVIPGYHMNKKHWNTVICDGSLSQVLIESFIRHSYDLVTRSKRK